MNVLDCQIAMEKNLKNCIQNMKKEGKGREQVNANELWYKIVESQIETGTPYLCYKDACNQKSNQKSEQ